MQLSTQPAISDEVGEDAVLGKLGYQQGLTLVYFLQDFVLCCATKSSKGLSVYWG